MVSPVSRFAGTVKTCLVDFGNALLVPVDWEDLCGILRCHVDTREVRRPRQHWISPLSDVRDARQHLLA